MGSVIPTLFRSIPTNTHNKIKPTASCGGGFLWMPPPLGYGSLKNYKAIQYHGAMPYIAFKSIHTGRRGGL